MDLVIEPMDALPCRLEVFTINGKSAEQNDFGKTFDIHYESGKRHGCFAMHFAPNYPTYKVLDKYNITEEEYCVICNELERTLLVGRCGWCVKKNT